MKNINFQRLSLKKKLLLSFMFTSIISLLLACVIFMLNDYLARRSDLIHEVTVLVDTLAYTSTAAITFDDKTGASEILQAVKVHPDIDMAALYRKDGSEIAFYLGGKSLDHPLPQKTLASQGFDNKYIHISRSIVSGNEQIGRIYVRYDLSNLHSRKIRFLELVLFVLALVSAIAYLIASKLMQNLCRIWLMLQRPFQRAAIMRFA